ncbi:MAG: hypothetical protein ABR600_06840 [Actinomycetota bacterium]
MIDEAHRDEPIRFFKELYPVVVGVGLALAAQQIVDLRRSGVPIRWEHVPLFVAWIAVAMPFAHLAVRFLDFTYGRRELGATVGRAYTLGNVAFGAGHFLGLMALALFVTRPFVFGYGLVIFLGGIVIRAALMRVHPKGWLAPVEERANLVHAGCIGGWLVVLIVCQLFLDGSAQTWVARGGVAAVGIAYPFLLYLSAYELFFPGEVEAPAG